MTRGLVVAAPRSGSGKTTVTLALAAALRREGLRVRAAKSGPDYIDGAFHAAATGAPCLNLDSWAMPPAMLDAVLAEQAADADLLLIETSMGLFDGVDAPPGRSGAGAELAARYDLPVLLVMDVSGQSQSAAAVARGFAAHRRDVQIAGVVLNRVGSERHHAQAAAAMAALPMPVLGSLTRNAAIALPERHLGLVQAGEHVDLARLLDALCTLNLDYSGISALARQLRLKSPLLSGEGWVRASRSQPSPQPSPEGRGKSGGEMSGVAPPGQRIALAQDAAFTFFYPHLAAAWRRGGAQIVPFSPLADEAPADDCDACWLPGGYPELHAATLAGADRFRQGMARFAETRPVHGECGGFMVLGESLADASGAEHRMLGLLSHRTSFARRKLHLGYREARLLAPSPIGGEGDTVRGHEFHYAVTTEPGTDAPLATLRDAAGRDLGSAGGVRGRVSGSFFHVIAPA